MGRRSNKPGAEEDQDIRTLLQGEKLRAELIIAILRMALYAAAVLGNILQAVHQEIPFSYEVYPLLGALLFSVLAFADVFFVTRRPRFLKYVNRVYQMGVILLDALVMVLFSAWIYHNTADPLYLSQPSLPPAALYCGMVILMTLLYLIVDIFRFSTFTSLYAAAVFTVFFLGAARWLGIPWTQPVFQGGLIVYFIMVPAAALLAALISYRFSRIILLSKRQERLQRFLPQTVARHFAQAPQQRLPEGEKQEVTILFADLCGFTRISETCPPAEVITLLNTYFSRMVEPIFTHQGSLDKFIGDGLMALFGAPVQTGRDADNALLAARGMLEGLAALNRERDAAGQVPLRMGIGIHTGPVVIGSVGSPRRQDYTALGDAVNTASRLEHATREYGTPLIFSQETRAALTADPGSPGSPFPAPVDLGEIPLRGRRRPIRGCTLAGLSFPRTASQGGQ